jgi:chromosome segregation ATPase
MPRKTDGEKIDELEKGFATLTERLDHLRKDLNTAGIDLANAVKAFTDFKTDLAVLKKDLEALRQWKDELKKEKDEHSRRLWSFGPNIVGAIVTVLLSAIVSGIVAYLATRH